jgi:transcription-repair coupling factor (superfamily II helicase)
MQRNAKQQRNNMRNTFGNACHDKSNATTTTKRKAKQQRNAMQSNNNKTKSNNMQQQNKTQRDAMRATLCNNNKTKRNNMRNTLQQHATQQHATHCNKAKQKNGMRNIRTRYNMQLIVCNMQAVCKGPRGSCGTMCVFLRLSDFFTKFARSSAT